MLIQSAAVNGSGLGLAVVLSLLVGGEGVEHDVQAQNDQQDSQDELQAVGDEHSTPGSLASGDGDSSGIADGLDHRHETLHQSGEGDAEHDDQRGEEHLVAAAGDLQEDAQGRHCLLYTSDAADELDGVDLGGRRIIKKKFFQAEDGIRDQPRSRGLGDVYKRQVCGCYRFDIYAIHIFELMCTIMKTGAKLSLIHI